MRAANFYFSNMIGTDILVCAMQALVIGLRNKSVGDESGDWQGEVVAVREAGASRGESCHGAPNQHNASLSGIERKKNRGLTNFLATAIKFELR